MDVAVYADASAPAPYLRVLFPGLDDIQTAAEKFLDPAGIPYEFVSDGDIPSSPYFPQFQTVDLSGPTPIFGWDFTASQQWATNYNAQYWQQQYDTGILGLSIDNSMQLSLAIATPENERTADQVAAVEFLSGVNTLQQSVQANINAATTPEELITILDQLG